VAGGGNSETRFLPWGSPFSVLGAMFLAVGQTCASTTDAHRTRAGGRRQCGNGSESWPLGALGLRGGPRGESPTRASPAAIASGVSATARQRILPEHSGHTVTSIANTCRKSHAHGLRRILLASKPDGASICPNSDSCSMPGVFNVAGAGSTARADGRAEATMCLRSAAPCARQSEPERRIEVLDERHRPGKRTLDAREPEEALRPSPQARRAEPVSLAAETHQSLEPATFARHTNEPIFEEPAPEIRLDLPHDEPRQRADGLHSLTKGWPVLGHDAVEDGLLRPVTLVTMAFVRGMRGAGGSHAPHLCVRRAMRNSRPKSLISSNRRMAAATPTVAAATGQAPRCGLEGRAGSGRGARAEHLGDSVIHCKKSSPSSARSGRRSCLEFGGHPHPRGPRTYLCRLIARRSLPTASWAVRAALVASLSVTSPKSCAAASWATAAASRSPAAAAVRPRPVGARPEGSGADRLRGCPKGRPGGPKWHQRAQTAPSRHQQDADPAGYAGSGVTEAEAEAKAEAKAKAASKI